MGFITGMTGEPMKGLGKIIKWKEMEFSPGLMVENILENIEMIESFDYILTDSESEIIIQKPSIKEFSVNNSEDLENLHEANLQSDFVLITSKSELQLDSEFKLQLQKIARNKNLILGLGVETGNLQWIEKELKPAGIMLKGGNEIRPGYKDFDELADILEYLEED